MTLAELLDHISGIAAKYRKHAAGAIALNKHMHSYEGAPLTQEQVDALLSNFMNFLGASWGVDYALYAKDLESLEAAELLPLKLGAPIPKEEEKRIITP